ncbi:hypothetical protein KO527_15520 [Pseudoalteromonas sp. C2R02]|uniref:hypothetical protein n=1 Tax=Pseudoalteromonas sp. C2R02 TaxID=2841565 RepID=UPI001C0A23D7|nr:hypothetical protein [Pseudoalteromonas sp. C2R02]MBU2970760.1 hypothetical protein [Pseudoalteromonas sp. C2R02]
MKSRFFYLIVVLAITACGGNSRQESRDVQVSEDKESNTTPIISVTSLKPPTPEECLRITSNDLTEVELDLSTNKRQLVNDTIKTTDPESSYQLFLRNSENLMAWLEVKEQPIDVAIHESNHYINYQIDFCEEYDSKAIFSGGQFHELGFSKENTEHNIIIAETIPEHLQTGLAYELYILQLNHKFDSLLDEFNAYVLDNRFQLKFKQLALPENDISKMTIFQVNDTINFMVFTQYYLKSLRLNYPETYELVDQPQARAFLQYLWQITEELLIEAYPYISTGYLESMLFYDEGTGIEFLKAAYTGDALMELDLLGINHLEESDWQQTYFEVNKN